MKQIDILYFEACPGWLGTLARVRQVLAESNLSDAVFVRTIAVETPEAAQGLRFVGSPTVRVDGCDVDPSVSSRTGFGLHCRLYEDAGRLEKLPSSVLIRAALGLEPEVAS